MSSGWRRPEAIEGSRLPSGTSAHRWAPGAVWDEILRLGERADPVPRGGVRGRSQGSRQRFAEGLRCAPQWLGRVNLSRNVGDAVAVSLGDPTGLEEEDGAKGSYAERHGGLGILWCRKQNGRNLTWEVCGDR